MRVVLVVFLLSSIARADEHQEEGWRVQASGPKSSKVGAHAALQVVIETRAGYHLNDDYPLNFTPTVNAAVAFDAARIEKNAATLAPCTTIITAGEHACRATVPVGFVAKSEGPTHLAGTLSFSACDDAHCLIEKIPVIVDIAVLR